MTKAIRVVGLLAVVALVLLAWQIVGTSYEPAIAAVRGAPAVGESASGDARAAAASEKEDVGALAGDSRVWIDPPSQVLELGPGEAFTATVMVDNAQDMVGYRIKMDWNSSVLRVTGVSDAGFLLEEPFFKSLNPPDPSQGSTFDYEVALLPPYEDGADGDGALVVIEMEAVGSGTSVLDLDGTKVTWMDKDEVIHEPAVEDGQVEIEIDLEQVFLPLVIRGY